ncbi:olfactory receptor 1-like [Archocentrus centrarchus]|uniref:olfactory receptor 1-like n=1 Tax=Archocentrus centrarchus TaxID=63155 RepID=UPI0011EA134B|nr:olfactory receptor 1-like [Archocentrus centrarchus]
MDFFNSALGKNITFVRPAYFIISGFTGIPNIRYYYVFLFFVYIISVLANAAVMGVICLDHNLRIPKYVPVFNLALVDLLGNSVVVPKVLDIFLFNHPQIPYSDCLTFLFFCYLCVLMQALNLVALSYDRVIAIVYPLHYPVKVTHRFMISLIASLWVFVITVMLVVVGLLTRLSFCQSVVINSYICDHGPIYWLACNDYTPNDVFGWIVTVLVLYLPLTIVLISYMCIGYALAKVATVQERMKGFKTCTAHLSLVAIYFIPQSVTFSLGADIEPNARILNLSLTMVFPPMLNPIIYVLQTREIKESLKNNVCKIIKTAMLHPAELELKKNMERLWQLDVLPYHSEKLATRSREDQEALNLL